jgi:hypothetical protein
MSFSCKSKGKAGTSSAASRSPRGRQIPRPNTIIDWPFPHVLFYYRLPEYAPFCLHYNTARHGPDAAAAAAVVVVLIKMFPIHPRPIDTYPEHASPVSMPVPQLTWQGVERYGRIMACHVYQRRHATHNTQLPQLQHACLPAYPDRVLNLDAQGRCYPLSLLHKVPTAFNDNADLELDEACERGCAMCLDASLCTAY